MKRALRWLLLWGGPTLILLFTVLCGFVVWAIASEPGTRWALRTAVHQLDGQVSAVRGTIWRGLRVGELRLSLPAAQIHLRDFELDVAWRELLDRRLHATNLSVGVLDLDVLKNADEEVGKEPFSFPVLPFRIALDRFFLGQLTVKLDGEPLLLDVRDLQASLAVTQTNAQLVFQNLNLGRDGILADIRGEFHVLELADPWPLNLHIETSAHSDQPDSPLCVRHFLPELPTAVSVDTTSQDEANRDSAAENNQNNARGDEANSQQSAHPVTDIAGISSACALDLEVNARGDLDALAVALTGHGQDVNLRAHAKLAPRAGFPLKQGDLDLKLADGSSLKGEVTWDLAEQNGLTQDHVVGWLSADRLNLALMAGDAVPPGSVTARLDFDAQLLEHRDPLWAQLNLEIDPASRWNEQALTGGIKTRLVNVAPAPQREKEFVQGKLWQTLQIPELSLNLELGSHSLKGEGSLGTTDSQIDFDATVSRLADVWPGLPGGVRLHGQLEGALTDHAANLNAVYTPDDATANEVGSAPLDAQVALRGQWGALDQPGSPEGWRGRVTALQVEHAGLGADMRSDTTIMFAPQAALPAWQWQIGATTLALRLPSGSEALVQHEYTHVGNGHWETRGGIDRLVVSRPIVQELRGLIPNAADMNRGRVILADDHRYSTVEIIFEAGWDLRFAGALAGSADLRRVSGDFIVPAEPEFPLGLQNLNLQINATPTGASSSRLESRLTITTEKMGSITATAGAVLNSPPGGGFALAATPRTVAVQADINDLSWTSMFIGDAMDVGGVLHADLRGSVQADGTFASEGRVTGTGIRVVRIDDGVRLLDGELSARLEGQRFILESLRFPARLRVTPDEWRTAEWVSTNPEAEGGSLTISGSWNLGESIGAVDVDLYRYPILQRSDRYAMVTGKLRVDAPLPMFSLSGQITADAGWVDLDMLSSVPTLDGDVVVVRGGKLPEEPKAPMDIHLDLTVDLGPRFYITGYGVNSGLVGQMRLLMHEGRLTAEGALRTRGGSIDIYGQHLQLRRGTITFQGDVSNPLLNIEALRTGVAVEAGVRVAGTAKRPRIDLVSYPEVSDVQKLSWLLLGRGPDDSGGDAALLFSVGTSFLGDGEPFYRRFGIDELTMRSGELGSTGSILPVESVVRGLDSGTSHIENQFIVASRRITSGVTASIEQALSDTGTVGRLSYRLSRTLSAQLSVGTVNGIALIYRNFFRD